jgi:hypothetical protein
MVASSEGGQGPERAVEPYKDGWNIFLPTSYTKCLEIWESQPPGTLKACTGTALPLPISNAHTEHLCCS